jgi:hypothetical protein
MANIDSTAVVDTTAACDLGRHQSCRKVVLSLTAGHLSDCACPCHEPAPVTDDELEAVIEAEAERAVEAALEAAHFGAEL